MALNARQRSLYTHRFNLWKPTRTVTAGRPGAETWALQQSNVAGYYRQRPHVSEPYGVGRFEPRLMDSTDEVHFEVTTVVGDGWILKNVTLNTDGSNAPTYGEFYRVQGAPRKIVASRRRNPNFLSVMVIDEPKAPSGVS